MIETITDIYNNISIMPSLWMWITLPVLAIYLVIITFKTGSKEKGSSVFIAVGIFIMQGLYIHEGMKPFNEGDYKELSKNECVSSNHNPQALFKKYYNENDRVLTVFEAEDINKDALECTFERMKERYSKTLAEKGNG